MAGQYAFGKTVGLNHEQAIARVTQELAKEGFGVLSDIDVAATLRKKLGLDVPPYRILGACNPQFAHRAHGIDSISVTPDSFLAVKRAVASAESA